VFSLFVLPVIIILLLGAAFGGSQQALIRVVQGDRASWRNQLVAALRDRPSTVVRRYAGIGGLQRAVERGDVDAGVVVRATTTRVWSTNGERASPASPGRLRGSAAAVDRAVRRRRSRPHARRGAAAGQKDGHRIPGRAGPGTSGRGADAGRRRAVDGTGRHAFIRP
jgi:hypothetical protein